MNGSSNSGGSGSGLVFVNPDQYKTSEAFYFNFKTSNSEVEYEVVRTGLGLTRELGMENIAVFSDSMLIVNQVTGEF